MSESASVDWSNQKFFVTCLELVTALRTACEGMLPVETRRNVNSIWASDGNSGGASLGLPRLRLCLHLDPSSLLAINQSPKAKAKMLEKVSLPISYELPAPVFQNVVTVPARKE